MKAESSPPQVVPVTKTKRTYSRLKEKWKDFGFAAPAIFLLTTFVFYPLVYSVYLSFTNWNMIKPNKDYVGVDNYTKILTGEMFAKVMKVTVSFTLIDVFFTLLIGLGLALLFNVSTRFFNFLRMIVFMPYYISMVIASMVFLWIYNERFGLANAFMNWIGLDPVNWLTNTSTALGAVVTVSLWKGVGFAMIIFIGGLRGIPKDYYEASNIDGAGKFKQFRYITLPLLSPITLFLVVTNFISSMQVFQSIKIMTAGGPLNSTKAVVYWIYEMAFQDYRTGRASALIVIFFIIIIALTALQFAVSKKKVHYEG
ncbi:MULTISPECIES: carbohydrate ABC transporter permease [unclassified Paenibacillus]|uniref:carbohydrate ABC transporter permease n=1 Tax=unclassified Paenibacillus TaxID=185978 RepID=UPI002F3F5625